MPRTEADLDRLMTAVEIHKAEGNRLGTLYLDKKLTAEEILDQAGVADGKLYDVLDLLAIERSEEFTDQDAQLREGRRGNR